MSNLEITNTELVEVRNQQVVTDSRKVAEVFGKEHKHVLESIRQVLVAENSATKFFYEAEYEYRGQKFPMYYMNRDGLSLLVMGFTGKKAMQWKLKYIEAFNQMEQQQKTQLTTADLFLQNALLMKQMETKQREQQKAIDRQQEILEKQQSTLDTLNGVCTDGTKRQKLNTLIRNFVNTHGLQYADGWNLFKEMYNNAYHTNLNLRITNYAKSNFLKKRPTVPQYFELTNQLDDALRVAEKM